MPAIAPVNEKPGVSLELETSIGTVVSLCGYIVQFCGLRGLHWSVSIAQLGARLFMAGVRAWVRRGLANPPRSLQTRPGFEIDWFAMTFADIPNSPWIPDAKYKTQEWSIKSLQAHVEEFEEGVPQESLTVSTAHRVVMIRRDLAQLTSWQGPASAEAVSLARSIEATMNILFRDSEQRDFTWSLSTYGGELIRFRLNRLEGKWNAHADELEAALSMWLLSVDELENKEETNHQDIVGEQKDDKWLRVKGSPSRPGMRVLGSYTESLHRDLSWWMPNETNRIIRLSRLKNPPEHVITPEELWKEKYRVVGPCGPEIDRRQFGVEELSEFTIETHGGNKNKSGSGLGREGESLNTPLTTEGDNSDNDFLAAEFLGPLKLLYAQDIFSSFFRALSMTLQSPLAGLTEARPKHGVTGDMNWKSFVLHNDQLSRLAKNIADTGIGSLSDVYLSAIPALSVKNKLPEVSVIVDLARQKARHHERLRHWYPAGEMYLWLFRVAMTFTFENEMSTLATFIFVDFLRQVSLAADLADKQIQKFGVGQPSELWQISALKQTFESELLSNFDGPLGVKPTLAALLQMYKNQRRPWKFNLSGDSGFCSESECGSSKTFNSYQKKLRYTGLHEAARTQGEERIKEVMRLAEDVNAKDVLGWTPLHYGVRQHDVVTALLASLRVDINARDLGEWTPLHYACRSQKKLDDKIDYKVSTLHGSVGSMPYNTVLRLLEWRADINAQGRDGVAPIHCAASTGFVEAVKLLTEAGADINVLDVSGKSALHWAAFYGKQATVEYLWENANRTLRDMRGRTALHLAAISGKWETVSWLINNGADVMARDRHMRIPLHQAAWDGKLDIVQLLCKNYPTAGNTSDWSKLTPMGCAVENGQEEVVQWLLKQPGANIDHCLVWAVTKNHAGIADILIKHGASLTDMFIGRSLLYESVLQGNEEIAEMLLKAGLRNFFDGSGNSVIKMVKGDEKERVFRSLLEKYDVNLGEE